MEQWVLTCIILDVGVIIANVVEQILISKKWNSMNRIEHLLLSLSLSDLIVGIVTLGVDVWYYERLETVNGTTTFNMTGDHEVVTVVIDSVFIFSIVASVFHVTAVAVERLCAIRFPRKYYIFKKFSFKCFTISAIWICAVLLASFCGISFHLLDSRTVTFMLGAVLVVIASLVLLVDMAVAYVLIKHQKNMLHDFTPEDAIKQHEKDSMKRVTVLFLFMGSSFAICILPIALGYLDTGLYHHISSVLVTLNSFINPCIYFFKAYYESRKLNECPLGTDRVSLVNSEQDKNSVISHV